MNIATFEQQVSNCIDFLSHSRLIKTPGVSTYVMKGAIQMLLEAKVPREERGQAYISEQAVIEAARQLNIPLVNGWIGISKRWFNPIDLARLDPAFTRIVGERNLSFSEIVALAHTKPASMRLS